MKTHSGSFRGASFIGPAGRKDSVFTYLFRQPEYTRELYLSLHPEDTDVTEADIKLVTLENVLTVGQYNDLGLQVRDKLIVLAEAQSTFSVNIALRMLLYLAGTYKEYAEEHSLDLYGTKPVQIPRPELYVVYTRDKKDTPEVIRLSDLYGGDGSAEITVKVIRSSGTGNIVDQYVRFCEIADEERKEQDGSEKAAERIIRRCKEEGVLVAFLDKREKEVRDIMVALFDEEWIAKMHDRSMKEEGREEERVSALKNLMKNAGWTIEQAMAALGLSPEEQKKYLHLL
ncbi:MAG: hypothetical protein E7425_04785 [Ruminococcaceae bacterium]|nr:hypothetical protein [Oscillospiraceae bacterium]